MKNKNYRLDIVPGIVIGLFAIFYMANIPGIQVFTGLGSTPLTNHFVPWLWGGVLLVLSLWLIVRGFRKKKKYIAEGGQIEKIDLKAALWERREVIASFIALGLYVALMGSVGFVITTIVYVFVQIMILTPRENWKKNVPTASITALVTGILLFYIFRYLLNVLLPIGVLKAFGL